MPDDSSLQEAASPFLPPKLLIEAAVVAMPSTGGESPWPQLLAASGLSVRIAPGASSKDVPGQARVLLGELDDPQTYHCYQADPRPTVILSSTPEGVERSLARARPADEVCSADAQPGEVIARLSRILALAQEGRRLSDVIDRWRAALSPAQVAAVLCIDLDEFARAVDRVGRPASDGLLEAVNTRLQRRGSQHDLIFRDRGDGFIGLLAGSSREEVMTRASSLQACVGAEPYQSANESIVLTASAGLVFVDRDSAGFTHKCAEMAMLMAKISGRNDLIFFDTLEQANLDGLTGVHSRRYFDDRFRREIDLARRSDAPLSLALFDLDDFGSLNKRFGHPVGDTALVTFARAARDGVGELGWVARYGGEEFCVVARLSCDELATVAERVRAKVADLTIQTADGGFTRMTVSVGVAAWRGDEARAVVQRASWLLKVAKDLGKDRIQCETQIDEATR